MIQVVVRAGEWAGAVARPLLLRARLHRERNPPAVANAIAAIEARWSELSGGPTPPDQPVVLLASAWRSGSTLLQRLIVSSGETLVWGEPWNRSDLIPRLADSLRPLGDGWPHHPVFLDEIRHDAALHEAWVANLFPDPTDLVAAHRALFVALFGEPARRAGYDRWGIKLVRVGVDAVAYLRFLFPHAALVFVHRNPYDSWVSYRTARLAAYARFPELPVLGALEFGRVWAEHVGGVLAAADRYDVLTVGYDELRRADASFRGRFEEHVGLHLDWSVLDRVVDGPGRRGGPAGRLYGHERAAIRWTTRRVAGPLGYIPS